jgi:hypothetical protein
VLHRLLIVAELTSDQPDGEWAQYRATGRACIVCPCGLNTGFVTKDEAAQLYREHAHANVPAAAVRIHPETGEASDVLRDMLGAITRE